MLDGQFNMSDGHNFFFSVITQATEVIPGSASINKLLIGYFDS